MNIDDKEKKLKTIIEEITGIKLEHKDTFNKDNKENISGTVLIIHDKKEKEIAKVKTLKDLENILLSLDKEIILNYAKNRNFSKWLEEIKEVNLAESFFLIEKEFDEGEKLRKKMIDVLE